MTPRIAGFTLVETLTALAVLAVALAIGVPGLAHAFATRHVDATRHGMVAALALARSEAIAAAVPVSVCPVDAAHRCRDDGVWDGGWMVFRDPVRAGQPRRAQDIVEVVDGPDGRLRIRGSSEHAQARFQPDGLAMGSTLTLRICSDDGERLLAEVILNNAGRPRTADHRDEALPCVA